VLVRRGADGGQPKNAVPHLRAHIGVRGLRMRIVVLGSVTVWAGHVEDDFNGIVLIGFGVELAVDRGQSAQELVGDIGEDGGATWRNFLFGEKEEKAAEEVVDGDGGTEFPQIGGERGGSVGGFDLVLGEAGMDGAEDGVDVGGREPAVAAVGETMRTASGVVDEAGFSGLLTHISSFWIWNAGVHPRGNADGCENKGVAGKAIRKSMKTKGRQNAPLEASLEARDKRVIC
jgi:hypothetical protein